MNSQQPPPSPKTEHEGQPVDLGDRYDDKSQRQSAMSILVRLRWPLAILAMVILACAYPLSRRLRMDRTIDQMFAADDPTLIAYQELRDAFGGNAAVLLVYQDNDLMSAAGIRRAGIISARVADVEGVKGVLSLAELNSLLGVIRPGGILTGLDSETPPLLRKDDIVAVAFERLFDGYTHSSAANQSAIVALLDEPDPQEGHSRVVRDLREIMREMADSSGRMFKDSAAKDQGDKDRVNAISQAVLVGEPVLLSEGFDLIERDGTKLAIWTLALLSPLVLILLRGLRWVVLQALVIMWAVTVTRAAMYLLDMKLSIVSSILAAICTVIAVTAVIHLGAAWNRRQRRGDVGPVAAGNVLTLILLPIFWACATDAAGFASLILSNLSPIRDFGWMMAIASMAVFVGVALFAPAAMTIGAESTLSSRPRRNHALIWRAIDALEARVRRIAVRLVLCGLRYRRSFLLATIVLAGFTVAGVQRLKIETSFLENFRDDSEIAQSYDRVEQVMKGAGVWDVVLDAPDELSDEYMESVRTLESTLREISVEGEQLTKVLSMADADRIAAAIPLLRIASPTVRTRGMREAIPSFADALLVPAGEPDRRLRIMLRSREHLPTEVKMRLIAEVERLVREHTTTPEWKALFASAAEENRGAELAATGTQSSPAAGRVTGYYVMIARLVSQILGDQWRCLAWATALVGILLVIATRSIKLAILALIPNVLPVLGVLGALGWYGKPMNMGAAMIAAVSVGLSIDGSIHFLWGFRQKLARGRSAAQAAIYAQRGVGLPMVFATIALTVGFLGLGDSEFIPTATFGVLTAFALVAGTVANLVLLPILVVPRKSSVFADR